MLLKHITIIVPLALNGIFVKSINIMLGSVETGTRTPLELKPRRIMSIIGTVTGNFSIRQAIVATTLDRMVLALPITGEIRIAKEVPMVEGIAMAKTDPMAEILPMGEKVITTKMVPMMGVIVRTETSRRPEASPAVWLAQTEGVIAMAEVVVITAHHRSPYNEACGNAL